MLKTDVLFTVFHAIYIRRKIRESIGRVERRPHERQGEVSSFVFCNSWMYTTNAYLPPHRLPSRDWQPLITHFLVRLFFHLEHDDDLDENPKRKIVMIVTPITARWVCSSLFLHRGWISIPKTGTRSVVWRSWFDCYTLSAVEQTFSFLLICRWTNHHLRLPFRYFRPCPCFLCTNFVFFFLFQNDCQLSCTPC